MSGHVCLEACDPAKLVDVLSALETARTQGVSGRADFSFYILTNLTVNGLDTFIDFHALRGGVDASVQMAPFNVLHQELISDTSQLHTIKPNLLVLALGWEGFAKKFDVVPDDVTSSLEELFDLAAGRSAAAIAVNTFVLPSAPTERAPAPGSTSGTIHAVNDWIRDYVRVHRDRFFLCDWGGYIQDIGRAQALDPRYALMAKAPFRPAFLTRYAADLARISRAMLGLNKKVLVLDCDNTLWGGVLGEDGPDGIKLDPNDYPGNAFFAVQNVFLDIARRGVVLAVCSKNNEADVLDVMSTNPHCLMQPSDFAAMRINWENKAENIKSLAAELNLGLDSFVFVDDSPFEIEMISSQLPDVFCVQVPDKLFEYPHAMIELGERFFFGAAQTSEDADRAKLYAVRKKAETAKATFSDTESYLRSLDITLDIHAAKEAEFARVAQLSGKTNQFNVDKKIYSEADIRAMADSDEHGIYVGVSADKFGEQGLTIVAIVEKTAPSQAHIDCMLMSCRVFERNLEHTFLDALLLDVQQKWGTETMTARHVASTKNQVCRDFFMDAGFRKTGNSKGVQDFEIDLDARASGAPDYIRLSQP